MKIDFELTTHDDCLDKIVPSDLRKLVSERDELKRSIEQAAEFVSMIPMHTQDSHVLHYVEQSMQWLKHN